MNGEIELHKLFRDMKPQLHEGEFVFGLFNSLDAALAHNPICLFQEAEGITAILARQTADSAGISYSAICAWITLTVHSSLEAVGLTATVSGALTEADISCNVVAAYYHDHLFIPTKDADRAMQVLAALIEKQNEQQTDS